MAGTRPHLLIFEPDARGHALEWIEHIYAAAGAAGRSPRITFVVAPALAKALKDHHPTHDSIDILPLKGREQSLCTQGNLAISGFARWWIVRSYLKRTNADHVLFMAFDHLSLPFGLGLRMMGKPVSGILFRPSVHYEEFQTYHPSRADRVRDLRKHVLYGRMLKNPTVRTIFSLDPYFPAYAGERYLAGHKVVSLADPAYPPPDPQPSDLTLTRMIPDDRTAFVFFGEITERKGIVQLLAALYLLPPASARRTAIMVAGRVDAALQIEVENAVLKLHRDHPDLWLHLENRRITAGEITALLRRSDVVLAPYQRFVGSSGVLLWSAQLAKPIISQDYGLVGQLTREYALGLAIDSTSPSAIAGAIEAALAHDPSMIGNRERMKAYATAHDVADFVPTLFAAIFGENLAA